MKVSHYDILQVSPRASHEIIVAAFDRLKATLHARKLEGDDEARNQLIFLEEAYAILASPDRRTAYDAALLNAVNGVATPAAVATVAPVHRPSDPSSGFSRWFLALAISCAAFGAYKFMGQSGGQKIQEKAVDAQVQQAVGGVRNDAYRAESERTLIQGVVTNQAAVIDRSYEIASKEADRRRAELEYRAEVGSQVIDLQRQRQEAQIQEMKWRQEQYEKERKLREQRAAADAPKQQLCTMYQLNGKYAEARAAGCGIYR